MSKKLRWGVVSIAGNFRENNEDRCLVDDGGRYFVVADGMGGQLAGETASKMAVDIVPKKLEQMLDFVRDPQPEVVKAIDKAVTEANGEIMALSELDPDYHNMGTTIVLGVRVGENLYVGGIGDSRAYLLRNKEIKRLTRDHSLAEALLDAGTLTKEEAAKHRYRTMLYRYLGCKEGSNGADAKPYDMQIGDRFVLCSDGASEGVSDDKFIDLLTSNADPLEAAEAIVKAAQEGGSKDNITCVTIYVD